QDYADWVVERTTQGGFDAVITSERQSTPLQGMGWDETEEKAPEGHRDILQSWIDAKLDVVSSGTLRIRARRTSTFRTVWPNMKMMSKSAPGLRNHGIGWILSRHRHERSTRSDCPSCIHRTGSARKAAVNQSSAESSRTSTQLTSQPPMPRLLRRSSMRV